MFSFSKENKEVANIKKLNKPHNGPKLLELKADGPIIKIKNLKKSYVNGSVVTNIIKGVDVEIYDGEFVVVLGPSGSGKTTLLNIISGLDRGTSGEVNVLGNSLINLDDDELTKFRRINIGYIFQQYGLIPNLKVKENIQIGSYLNKLNVKETMRNMRHELKLLEEQHKYEIWHQGEDRIDISEYPIKKLTIGEIDDKFKKWKVEIVKKYDLIKEDNHSETIEDIMRTLGIESIKDKYPSQLSGGQQQRVSIGRVFAKKPRILFADEPTGAVDEEMSEVILDAFVKINRKYNTTIIIVTHNPEIAKLATKVIKFKDGYIESITNNE